MRQAPVLAVAVSFVILASAVAVATLAVAPEEAAALSSDHGASFSVRCAFSHRAEDDPIVHPGDPGMAHSHDFFGNRSTDANSTYNSLLTAGTTCTRPGDTAAYWIPTVSFEGNPLEAKRFVVYYRAGEKDHKRIRPYPAGLKMISDSHIRWSCGRGSGTKAPPSSCSSGELTVRVGFPDCSDGRIDSADHKAHVAYSRITNDGTQRCPRSHPRSVPTLNMNATFPIPTRTGKVTLSSGVASSMHADFYNSFNQDTLGNLVKRCINDVAPSELRPEFCQTPAR
jgi:hypothetical protein